MPAYVTVEALVTLYPMVVVFEVAADTVNTRPCVLDVRIILAGPPEGQTAAVAALVPVVRVLIETVPAIDAPVARVAMVVPDTVPDTMFENVFVWVVPMVVAPARTDAPVMLTLPLMTMALDAAGLRVSLVDGMDPTSS